MWFYAQPWFLDFSLFGVAMRDLFQVHAINLSVAVWVGFLALFGIAGAVTRRPEERFLGTGRRLAGIGLLFLISLAARTADQAACTLLPTGTHPLWHVLNAVILYALVATAVRHRESAG